MKSISIGPEFAIVPEHVPVKDILASAEQG